MKHTRVMIQVTVFSGDGNRYYISPGYDDPKGETSTIIFPCDNYGDLLFQMVERATDEYTANVEIKKEIADDE